MELFKKIKKVAIENLLFSYIFTIIGVIITISHKI